jgi:hypothetical protein
MSVSNRSEIVAASSPRGQVEVVRQQWRSQRPNSPWKWVWAGRRSGQRDWRQGATALEAIRQATLLPPGKQPSWLRVAARTAQRELGQDQ